MLLKPWPPTSSRAFSFVALFLFLLVFACFAFLLARSLTCVLACYGRSSQMIAVSFADTSLAELVRLLCFEDGQQAVDFLSTYNLTVSHTGQVRNRTGCLF